MTPTTFPEVNVVLAEEQPEYLPLPAFQDAEQTISLWRLTWRERLTVALTGRLWLRQLNFDLPLQPLLPQVECPFEREAEPR